MGLTIAPLQLEGVGDFLPFLREEAEMETQIQVN